MPWQTGGTLWPWQQFGGSMPFKYEPLPLVEEPPPYGGLPMLAPGTPLPLDRPLFPGPPMSSMLESNDQQQQLAAHHSGLAPGQPLPAAGPGRPFDPHLAAGQCSGMEHCNPQNHPMPPPHGVDMSQAQNWLR